MAAKKLTDRELLEAAAKTAGVTIHHWAQEDYPIVVDAVGAYGWQPLRFDSDALRLAVMLHFYVGPQRVEVWRGGKKLLNIFEDGDDPYAATRRAIVRAAAEIETHLRTRP